MCNLCSGRLFLVPNPCCCCDLRCGVMWTGIGDIIVGLLSIVFPITQHVEFESGGSVIVDGAIANDNLEEPDFDVQWPRFHFVENLDDSFNVICYATANGEDVCVGMTPKDGYILQIISGVAIICAAYGVGRHHFSRFLLGCTWLFFRILIVVILLSHLPTWLKSNHGPLRRYGIFTALHVIIDVYLSIIVRYYAMECYDSYRYQKIINSARIRREPIETSKAAPKTRSGKDKGKGLRKSRVLPQKEKGSVRDNFQKRRPEGDVERVPVWDRKNEVIFYGEDYTDWDPAVFLARWELLNELEKQEKEKAKAAVVAPPGLAFLLKVNAMKKTEQNREDHKISSLATQHKPFNVRHYQPRLHDDMDSNNKEQRKTISDSVITATGGSIRKSD